MNTRLENKNYSLENIPNLHPEPINTCFSFTFPNQNQLDTIEKSRLENTHYQNLKHAIKQLFVETDMGKRQAYEALINQQIVENQKNAYTNFFFLLNLLKYLTI